MHRPNALQRWIAGVVAIFAVVMLASSLAFAGPEIARTGPAAKAGAVLLVTQTIDPCHKRCSPLTGTEYKDCRNACAAEGGPGPDYSDYNKRHARCMIQCQPCKLASNQCPSPHGFYGCVKTCTDKGF
jgi:hypothetical protein